MRENAIRMNNAVRIPLNAIRRLSFISNCSTIVRKTGLNPTGFTRVNKEEKARIKNELSSVITFVQVHEHLKV